MIKLENTKYYIFHSMEASVWGPVRDSVRASIWDSIKMRIGIPCWSIRNAISNREYND